MARASLRSTSPPLQQKGVPFILFFHSQPALGIKRLIPIGIVSEDAAKDIAKVGCFRMGLLLTLSH